MHLTRSLLRIAWLRRHLQPDVAVAVERNGVDAQTRAFAIQAASGSQVIGALVQGADDGRSAGEAVCERPAQMRAFGLRGKDLARMSAEQGDVAAADCSTSTMPPS